MNRVFVGGAMAYSSNCRGQCGCRPPAVPVPHSAPDGPALPTKRKTVKLFWRELKLAGVRGGSGSRFGPSPTLWASLEPVSVDTARLEHLFESRAKDVLPSKVSTSSSVG